MSIAAPPRIIPFASFDSLDDVPESLDRAVVAIGNFDGVHRGHQAVLAAAELAARAEGAPRRPVLALTFEPHPRTHFQPAAPLFRLTPAHVKARLIEAAGFDGVLVLPFDAGLAAMSAEDFVARILVERLKITGATVGWDFHFGHKRRGSPAFLADAGQRLGFPVDIVPHFDDESGLPISSSRVRDALAEGDLALANGLLGYRWFVEGTIVDGDKRGRTLGFPTANMRLAPDCRLRHGVYAVEFTVDGKIHQAAANYGRRPQFDNGAPVLETYVFDFSGDLYGRSVEVRFISFLRPELKFASLDDLLARMTLDCEEARTLLTHLGPGSAIDLALDEGRERVS
jgi:riboflavin kinase / FMN adenylyltransferase